MGPLEPDLIELILGLLCFLLVFVILAKILLPRIGKTLAEREVLTEGRLELAEEVRLEAERVRAEYQAELSAARHKALGIRQSAREEGAALLAGVRAEAQKVREELVAASAAQLEAERVIAEAELREGVLALATELAGRIVGEPLTDVERNRVIADAFFADVDAGADTAK
ncbi:hypothetical protein ACFV7Q_32600 [Streptomyces sp. NPDC059851]|uniref:F0F1 ATP synthase subunit B family protein n=1 Tax=Streptomyces sp. NPDC059851 TaxID=3346971 RepID=UPI00365E9C09